MNGAVIVETRDFDIQAIFDKHVPFLPAGWEVMHFDHVPINNIYAYNSLLTSKEFWDYVPYDKVLIFQHDSGLLRTGINDFLEYDYVGAPWNFQDFGGNGGLSLRGKEAMLQVLSETRWQHGTHPNEDVFFCNEMHRMGMNLAPREVCSKFSVESIFEMGTLGYHAIDKYLTPCQQTLAINQYKDVPINR